MKEDFSLGCNSGPIFCGDPRDTIIKQKVVKFNVLRFTGWQISFGRDGDLGFQGWFSTHQIRGGGWVIGSMEDKVSEI